uniref:Myeloid-derived growth factor n=1 Tax=Cyprinus carpio TaxID=7962 RepID=A0A8C1TT18_CYPCA
MGAVFEKPRGVERKSTRHLLIGLLLWIDDDVQCAPSVTSLRFKGTKKYKCTFTYACQGGTNEQWQMSVGLSDDDQMFSCSVWRPQGKSYLFFTQFKAEIKGAKIEYAAAYSQMAVGGQRDVALKEEEYIVSESSVTHREGKFHSELSKLTVIGRTRHDEL